MRIHRLVTTTALVLTATIMCLAGKEFTMPKSEDLPALTGKISTGLAAKPEVFITNPVELRILHTMTDEELDNYAVEHGWRVVRRVGGRVIEFYNDASVRTWE